jgi:hypothetical protein
MVLVMILTGKYNSAGKLNSHKTIASGKTKNATCFTQNKGCM